MVTGEAPIWLKILTAQSIFYSFLICQNQASLPVVFPQVYLHLEPWLGHCDNKENAGNARKQGFLNQTLLSKTKSPLKIIIFNHNTIKEDRRKFWGRWTGLWHRLWEWLHRYIYIHTWKVVVESREYTRILGPQRRRIQSGARDEAWSLRAFV